MNFAGMTKEELKKAFTEAFQDAHEVSKPFAIMEWLVDKLDEIDGHTPRTIGDTVVMEFLCREIGGCMFDLLTIGDNDEK